MVINMNILLLYLCNNNKKWSLTTPIMKTIRDNHGLTRFGATSPLFAFSLHFVAALNRHS